MNEIASRLIKANVWASLAFDRIVPFPPENHGRLEPHDPAAMFAEAISIADVGGGKKPYTIAANLNSKGKIYVG